MSVLIDKVYRICKLFESSFHIDDFLEEFICQARSILESEYFLIVLYNQESAKPFSKIFCYKSNKLTRKKSVKLISVNSIEKITSATCSNTQVLNFSTKAFDSKIKKNLNKHIGIIIKSMLASPMVSRGTSIGLIAAINKKNKTNFSNDDEKLIRVLASQSAMLIENSRLHLENQTKDRLSILGQRIIDSAHGLKNLLNNLDGGTYIVEQGTLSKNMKEVDKGWDILKRNSNRLRELVLDILLYSRPKKPEYKLSNINNICVDIKELIEQSAKESNITVNLDLDSSIKLYCFDPKGIYRCILNLISNSIYACQEKGGGEITLKTKIDSEKNLRIIITDNGSGISKQNLDHIFDVFFTTKGSKGTGLGLAVTRKIVIEHRGSITVESEIGKGSIFTIILPKDSRSECYRTTKKLISY